MRIYVTSDHAFPHEGLGTDLFKSLRSAPGQHVVSCRPEGADPVAAMKVSDLVVASYIGSGGLSEQLFCWEIGMAAALNLPIFFVGTRGFDELADDIRFGAAVEFQYGEIDRFYTALELLGDVADKMDDKFAMAMGKILCHGRLKGKDEPRKP